MEYWIWWIEIFNVSGKFCYKYHECRNKSHMPYDLVLTILLVLFRMYTFQLTHSSIVKVSQEN